MANIAALDYRFETEAFAKITEEAKQFIKKLLVRRPEKRPTATLCLKDPWLAYTLTATRSKSLIDPDALADLADALDEQDRLEDVHASTVLRTFVQSPYDSPESETDSSDGESED